MGGGWTRVRADDGRLVLRAEGAAVGRLLDDAPSGDGVRYDPSSRVTAAIDTGTDRLVRVTATAAYRRDGERTTIYRAYVFENVGRTEVRRPRTLGATDPTELLWDAAGY
jgi:hypothetical protein